MWCNPWIIKEAVEPLMIGLGLIGAGALGLYIFAKVTYKMHKMGIIK